MTETIRTSGKYELVKGTSASPANGMGIVVRLSDHEVSEWFGHETLNSLEVMSEEIFDDYCDTLF